MPRKSFENKRLRHFNFKFFNAKVMEQNHSYTSLAHKLGLSEGTVQNWTSGRSKPYYAKIAQLANILNVAPEQLSRDCVSVKQVPATTEAPPTNGAILKAIATDIESARVKTMRHLFDEVTDQEEGMLLSATLVHLNVVSNLLRTK